MLYIMATNIWVEIFVSNNYEDTAWECSNCGLIWDLPEGTPFDHEMHYCPKCGCKMSDQKFVEREWF